MSFYINYLESYSSVVRLLYVLHLLWQFTDWTISSYRQYEILYAKSVRFNVIHNRMNI